MPAADHRLTTAEMASFVADGYLRFDQLVPEPINRAALDELPSLAAAKFAALGLGTDDDDGLRVAPESLDRLDECYVESAGIGRYLRLDAVQGIIESLVGANPVFDHDFVHQLRAGHRHRQHLHADAIVDTETPDFDIQLFYFPHDVEPDGGGTRFVPGSHLRRVGSTSTARYQHLVGEEFFAGKAGTVLVFHHGLWHAGQANPGASDRWMYKIRLGPTAPQVRLWNTDDFDQLHNAPSDHVFAHPRTDSVAAILRRTPPWLGTDEARRELTRRVELWRYLSGDRAFDADYYLTRQERRARATSARPVEP